MKVLYLLSCHFSFREAIVNGIPENLKYAVTVGIGLFITFIGLQSAGIIVGDEMYRYLVI